MVGLADNVALMGRDGMRVAIQDSAAPIQDRAGQIMGAVMVFHDVSGERQLRRKLVLPREPRFADRAHQPP